MTILPEYTAEQIASFAQAQRCTVEQFKRRWIIVHNGACFIHGPEGYRPAVKNALDIHLALRKYLGRVPKEDKSPAGINWEYQLGAGTKDKSNERIITDYGSLAMRHVLKTDIPYSYYDPSDETFNERVCPLRNIVPAYDERIDQWIEYLGGDQPEVLRNWIATCPDLSQPSAAVYLHAGKGAGKTMFANGMSRLWDQSPTPLSSAVGTFNASIVDCPLIFADEEIPRGVTSGFIRDFVAAMARQIKRKGLAEAKHMGAVRLVISANNADLLRFDREDFGHEDIAATAARILYFRCSPKAATYLESLGGFQGTADWVRGDRIAAHALWLAQNRTVTRGGRFLIEGGIDIVHRNLATSGGARDRTIEWICRAMLHAWPEPRPGILFGAGELYVNASFVQQTWEQLLGDRNPPSLTRIGTAFRALTLNEPSQRRFYIGTEKVNGKPRRADFYRIDPKYVYDNADKLQIGTEETFRELICRPQEVTDGGTPAPANGHGGEVIDLFNPFNGNVAPQTTTATLSMFDQLNFDPFKS